MAVNLTFSKASAPRSRPSNPSNVTSSPPQPPVNPPGGVQAITGIGITLNDRNIGGVKRVIEESDVLFIPIFWEYNISGVDLINDGLIVNDGEINIG